MKRMQDREIFRRSDERKRLVDGNRMLTSELIVQGQRGPITGPACRKIINNEKQSLYVYV